MRGVLKYLRFFLLNLNLIFYKPHSHTLSRTTTARNRRQHTEHGRRRSASRPRDTCARRAREGLLRQGPGGRGVCRRMGRHCQGQRRGAEEAEERESLLPPSLTSIPRRRMKLLTQRRYHESAHCVTCWPSAAAASRAAFREHPHADFSPSSRPSKTSNTRRRACRASWTMSASSAAPRSRMPVPGRRSRRRRTARWRK